MKSFNTFRWTMVLSAVLTVILGILFVANPFGASETIVLLAGGLLIVSGVIGIIQFVVSRGEAAHSSGSLIGGIVRVAVGIFAFTHIGIGLLLSVMSLLISVFIIVSGVTGFDYSLKMRRAGFSGWVFNLVLSIIILIGGIFMVIDPFEAIETTFLFIGVILIMDGIFEAVMALTVKDISYR